MPSLLILFLLWIPARASGICPDPSESAKSEVVRRLETSEKFRIAIGATPTEYQSVHVLTDESTCDILQISAATQGISRDHPDTHYTYAYVRSNKYYFIVSVEEPITDDSLYFGLAPLYVFNRQYQL